MAAPACRVALLTLPMPMCSLGGRGEKDLPLKTLPQFLAGSQLSVMISAHSVTGAALYWFLAFPHVLGNLKKAKAK